MSAGQPSRRRMEQCRPACFLGKPFAIDTLLAIVDRVGAAEDGEPGAADALTGRVSRDAAEREGATIEAPLSGE